MDEAVKSMTALEADGCGKNSTKTIRADLLVPPTLPTDITSNVIVATYVIRVKTNCLFEGHVFSEIIQFEIIFLQITTLLSLFHINPVTKIPIEIGTQPIQDFRIPSSPEISKKIQLEGRKTETLSSIDHVQTERIEES